jgi:hypothetical protein
MHPYYHAVSSTRKHGGVPADYLLLHGWFDEWKAHICDFRHRALRHHAYGIYEAERVFGSVIPNSDGRSVPTRILGEQHVREDCGRIPSLGEWLKAIRGERWMISPREQEASCTLEWPASGLPGALPPTLDGPPNITRGRR